MNPNDRTQNSTFYAQRVPKRSIGMKAENKDLTPIVMRSSAESLANKALQCIDDNDLRELMASLLMGEYYHNKTLYQHHLERYGDGA
tara:strand:- start:248 stop:508 length:261 start_codon:yes stop_codon:yes gene_type:complete